MNCEYAIYDNTATIKPKILCTAKCGLGACIHQKLCLKVERFIPTENMGDCLIMQEENKKNIPVGSNFVRAVRKGKLYVEDGNRVLCLDDTIGSVTNYVYLKKNADNSYEVSLFPFVEEKTSPKKKQKKKVELEEVENVQLETDIK